MFGLVVIVALVAAVVVGTVLGHRYRVGPPVLLILSGSLLGLIPRFGDVQFEGLRPHLPTTGEAAKFRTAYEVRCDNPTLMVLSLEIGRIEKEWMVEASGRTPKHRG